MTQLTIKELSRVDKGDVLFHINPYENGNQSNVTISTIVATGIKEKKIVGFESSALYPSTYSPYASYISDICFGIKATFLDLEEAINYLEDVKKGKFNIVVKEHHDLCKNMFKEDSYY